MPAAMIALPVNTRIWIAAGFVKFIGAVADLLVKAGCRVRPNIRGFLCRILGCPKSHIRIDSALSFEQFLSHLPRRTRSIIGDEQNTSRRRRLRPF
jgi:hypothetical protein